MVFKKEREGNNGNLIEYKSKFNFKAENKGEKEKEKNEESKKGKNGRNKFSKRENLKECWTCEKIGHFRVDCKIREKRNS